jgi:hypothetical protein
MYIIDDLLIAYSQILHIEPPADRTVKALDRYISKPESHGNKEWWGHRMKYRLDGEKAETKFPDLVSLYTPAENDYLSRFIDKALYRFFLVCLTLEFRPRPANPLVSTEV